MEASNDPKFIETKKVVPNKKEQKKQIIQYSVLGVLVALFLFLIFTTFFSGEKKKMIRQMSQSPASGAAAAVQPMMSGENLVAPVLSEGAASNGAHAGSDEEWGISPFSLKPKGEATVQQEESITSQGLDLQGIVYEGSGNSYVIINEKVLKEGERIADNKIKEIRPNEIVLESDSGETKTLSN